MKQVAVIGIDLAKRSFQLHGAWARRVAGVPGEVEPREAAGLSCLAATMRSGDGSLCSGQPRPCENCVGTDRQQGSWLKPAGPGPVASNSSGGRDRSGRFGSLAKWDRPNRYGCGTGFRTGFRSRQAAAAATRAGTPTRLIAWRMLYARAVRLNSPRTFSSCRVRKAPWPIHCLMEPNGCSTDAPRRTNRSGRAARRSPIRSRMASFA